MLVEIQCNPMRRACFYTWVQHVSKPAQQIQDNNTKIKKNDLEGQID